MPKEPKTSPESPIRTKLNENILILVHIVYAMSLFLGFWGLIAAIVVFLLTHNLLAKDHLKYIIKTYIVYFIFILAFMIFGVGFIGFMGLSAFFVSDQVNGEAIIAAQGLGLGIFLLVVYFALVVWYYLRLIGGWIAYFRKEPIQGYFGIRLKK